MAWVSSRTNSSPGQKKFHDIFFPSSRLIYDIEFHLLNSENAWRLNNCWYKNSVHWCTGGYGAGVDKQTPSHSFAFQVGQLAPESISFRPEFFVSLASSRNVSPHIVTDARVHDVSQVHGWPQILKINFQFQTNTKQIRMKHDTDIKNEMDRKISSSLIKLHSLVSHLTIFRQVSVKLWIDTNLETSNRLSNRRYVVQLDVQMFHLKLFQS